LTASTVLSVGITDRIAFDIEDLKTFLKQNNAEMLLLAHNRLDDTADPTEEDILLTRKIRNLLDDEVYLLDHVAVSTDNAVSMRARGCFRSFE
jgi:DNA repair protein RadC